MSRPDETGTNRDKSSPEGREVGWLHDEDLTEEECRDLERRFEEDLKNPKDSISWEELQERWKAARNGR